MQSAELKLFALGTGRHQFRNRTATLAPVRLIEIRQTPAVPEARHLVVVVRRLGDRDSSVWFRARPARPRDASSVEVVNLRVTAEAFDDCWEEIESRHERFA